jgi:L,D-transpeptidase ErfK/SrfK
MPDTVEFNPALSSTVRRNASSFRALDWQPYFDNLRNGAILVDINSRALHYWAEDGVTYRLYPSSVPLSEDLTRRGRTAVTLKDPTAGLAPDPAMRQRNPEWPDYVPPGPDNPLGTRALHLSWTYYRIHGTHDTRKIGRRSSNGCIGLYNEHIEELFAGQGRDASVANLTTTPCFERETATTGFAKDRSCCLYIGMRHGF